MDIDRMIRLVVLLVVGALLAGDGNDPWLGLAVVAVAAFGSK
jgi:hypothetical protein